MYPTSHSSSAVEAIAIPEKSWSEIFSDKLDDFIGYFLPEDKPEYEKPAQTSSHPMLPTEVSFNGCTSQSRDDSLMTDPYHMDHISIICILNTLN